MTPTELIRKIAEMAKTHQRRIFAVDFAPSPDGISLIFRFDASRDDDNRQR
jgi:hypothetical protein